MHHAPSQHRALFNGEVDGVAAVVVLESLAAGESHGAIVSGDHSVLDGEVLDRR